MLDAIASPWAAGSIPWNATWVPAWASERAMAKPIPRVEPVTGGFYSSTWVLVYFECVAQSRFEDFAVVILG
jgi:hypothetical protein